MSIPPPFPLSTANDGDDSDAGLTIHSTMTKHTPVPCRTHAHLIEPTRHVRQILALALFSRVSGGVGGVV